MKELVELEEEMLRTPGRVPTDDLLIKAKKDGFSDKYLSKILKVSEKDIRKRREELGVKEGWLAVPVSGVDNASYYYSSYNVEDKSTATVKVLSLLPVHSQKTSLYSRVLSLADADLVRMSSDQIKQ